MREHASKSAPVRMVKHFPWPALLRDLSPPLHHSTGTVFFFLLSLLGRKKALLHFDPASYQSYTSLHVSPSSWVAFYKHVCVHVCCSLYCRWEKKSNPLIRGPCTYWTYPAVGSLLQCNLLQILERLIFNVAEKSLVLEIFFSGYLLIKSSRKVNTYSWIPLPNQTSPTQPPIPAFKDFFCLLNE